MHIVHLFIFGAADAPNATVFKEGYVPNASNCKSQYIKENKSKMQKALFDAVYFSIAKQEKLFSKISFFLLLSSTLGDIKL